MTSEEFAARLADLDAAGEITLGTSEGYHKAWDHARREGLSPSDTFEALDRYIAARSPADPDVKSLVTNYANGGSVTEEYGDVPRGTQPVSTGGVAESPADDIVARVRALESTIQPTPMWDVTVGQAVLEPPQQYDVQVGQAVIEDPPQYDIEFGPAEIELPSYDASPQAQRQAQLAALQGLTFPGGPLAGRVTR